MRYLLDTDICIYMIKNKPPRVLQHFVQCQPKDVALSTISLFELQVGVEKSRHKEQTALALSHFLAPFTNILAIDQAAAQAAAKIRANLECKGTPIGPYDLLIAAVAKSRGLTLVSNNVREYERVEGLMIENWAD